MYGIKMRRYNDADQYDQLIASCKNNHDINMALQIDRQHTNYMNHMNKMHDDNEVSYYEK